MTNTIKIGRREFDSNTFIEAVKSNKTYSQVCESLGMNKNVQTTLNNIKSLIADLQLDISHFTYKYTMSDKVGQSSIKDYTLTAVNKSYYEAFQNSFDKLTSWQQYKVHCGDYLESLKDINFATITVEDIENYVNSKTGSEQTKHNCKSHIRSMMMYICKNDIEGAFNKVSKEMLLYLI